MIKQQRSVIIQRIEHSKDGTRIVASNGGNDTKAIIYVEIGDIASSANPFSLRVGHSLLLTLEDRDDLTKP